MLTVIKRFRDDDSGPTMVEYGLLVALIALVVGAAAQVLGTNLSALFSDVGAYLANTSVNTAGP
jgi:pilus assembly protein Flp/PilA